MFQSNIRNAARGVLNTPPCRWSIDQLGKHDRRANVLRVLTFHHLESSTQEGSYYPGVHSGTPDEFARLLDSLAGYNFVSIEEILHAARNSSSLPPRSVLITFDDAYRSIGEYAVPELTRRGIPAVIFVATAYPDAPRHGLWWDRLHASIESTSIPHARVNGCNLDCSCSQAKLNTSRNLMSQIKLMPHHQAMEFVDQVCETLGPAELPNGVMTWERLAEVSREGIALGGHTHSHPLLNRLPLDEARAEIRQSLDELEARLGTRPTFFAYPAGGHNADVVTMLAEEGIELAMTTDPGTNRLDRCDFLRLKRINVSSSTTPTLVKALMLR